MTDRDTVTYYFVRAWFWWLRDRPVEAEYNLYQASGFAGLRWPWMYRLPKRGA